MKRAARYGAELAELARLYRVQASYRDLFGRRRRASGNAILEAMAALGAPLHRREDIPDALRIRRQELWRRLADPVLVAWEGRAPAIELRLGASTAAATLACRLNLEEGGTHSWSVELANAHQIGQAEVEGAPYVTKALDIPERMVLGYHRLHLELDGQESSVLVISAPARTFVGARHPDEGAREWGVFLPLYALHTRKSWGVGDFSDLQALLDWVSGLGGSLVATLPLLAAFLDEPFDPSPYAPVSRLFWNELFVDVSRSPELPDSPEARAVLDSLGGQIESLRAMSLVDYRAGMAAKRRVLEPLAASFFSRDSRRRELFQGFLRATPALEDYAAFRAACERRRAPWPAWPSPARDGELGGRDLSPEGLRYHLYVQWLASEQLESVRQGGREAKAGLLLDLPLGVHPGGYDTWRHREAFVERASAGAPPDDLNSRGQGWGFPPLHPHHIRDQEYRYPIACLRHLLGHARVLRIDHVMGLHRLFLIPEGRDPTGGVYVRYRAEELYAILALESHRAGALIVGEDLGTVPAYVRRAMARRRVQRTYVLQYGLDPDPMRALTAVPAHSLASLNTHDLAPFAAFWESRDIDERLSIGLLDEGNQQAERKRRATLKESLVASLEDLGRLPDPAANLSGAGVAAGCLAQLSASDARIAVANLEDLWGETGSQNVPGTTWEQYPNWRQRARHGLEAFRSMPHVLGTLQQMDHERRRGGP
ncbi:MAG: 4-alpha-glucanotransferase [Actinomycetota bacterium]